MDCHVSSTSLKQPDVTADRGAGEVVCLSDERVCYPHRTKAKDSLTLWHVTH